MSGSSYLTILRATSIMGAASILSILSGIVKMKAAAVLLGPAGVGLVGLYQSLMQTGSQVAGLGFGTVGTRQIAAAEAEGGAAAVGPIRRALFWGTFGLALIGGLVFLFASGWIATYVLQVPELQPDVAWISLGVALTIATGSQGALLTGLRRTGDLAWVQVTSGILGAILGILALWLWGATGVLVMVLAAPFVTFTMGHLYVARLGRPEGPRTSLGRMAGEWRHMALLGVAFMLSGLVASFGHLAIRTLVQRELGADDLGHFQAAWGIGITYLGFVLGAMTTDYFPRLSATIGDQAAATRMVNEQTEVALILCGPVLLAMLALTPWVIRLLYTAEFGPAIAILRWQILGDILKVMSWPLGFVLLAAGAGRTFVVAETIGIGVFVGVVAVALPLIGITATGIGFLLLYVVYLPLVYLLCRRRIGFRWSSSVIRQAIVLSAAAILVDVLVRYSCFWGGVVGIALALAFSLHGLLRLARHSSLEGRGGKLASCLRAVSFRGHNPG
jgi:O-antigen/teichoic acid export membrane protein